MNDWLVSQRVQHQKERERVAYLDGYNKAVEDVFNFLKTKRDKKYMRLNLDDIEIKKYKEQLKEGAENEV